MRGPAIHIRSRYQRAVIDGLHEWTDALTIAYERGDVVQVAAALGAVTALVRLGSLEAAGRLEPLEAAGADEEARGATASIAA